MFKVPLLTAFAKDTWVRPFMKQYKKTLVLALLLGFLTFFSAAALMFNSGYLISRAASLPENILMIYIPVVLTRGFGISRPVFRYIERLVSHNWVLKMTSKLRLKLYEKLETDGIFFKRNYRMGDVLGLLAEDINHIQDLYLRTIFPTVIAWSLYVFIVLALGFFSLWFALVMALLFLILVAVFPLWSILVNGSRQEKEKQMKHRLYTELTDNVLGVSDWIFSQRGTAYVALHEQTQAELLDLQAQMRRFNNRRAFLLQSVFGVIILALIWWTSQRFVGNHGGAANWIAAFVLSVFPLVEAFDGLPSAAEETNRYQDSLVRLNEVPTRQEVPQRTLANDSFELEIKKVSFTYPQTSKEVLKDLSLTIPQGHKIAILGRSGSGKSTLGSLLRGDLVPTSGEVTLGGIATATFGDQIADSIGVIQQSPYLFHTTILNNLRLGDSQASKERVWQVLEQVGLKELVESLPEGLETMVDEAGLRFSGGERHRMALARLLLKETPIVLFDEPTVGLDPITEQALIDTFLTVLKDKTMIWITHHLQGIEKMDQVIFIEDGQLEISGSPQQLARENLRYQQLKAIDEGR
ncbi:thiol reductant ABC exporter subunit CydC [Enterococcus sp. LJL98]